MDSILGGLVFLGGKSVYIYSCWKKKRRRVSLRPARSVTGGFLVGCSVAGIPAGDEA